MLFSLLIRFSPDAAYAIFAALMLSIFRHFRCHAAAVSASAQYAFSRHRLFICSFLSLRHAYAVFRRYAAFSFRYCRRFFYDAAIMPLTLLIIIAALRCCCCLFAAFYAFAIFYADITLLPLDHLTRHFIIAVFRHEDFDAHATPIFFFSSLAAIRRAFL